MAVFTTETAICEFTSSDNLHILTYVERRSNRMVKGDRLRYDTIAAIYFLITYKTGGGGGGKDTSLIYGRNEK